MIYCDLVMHGLTAEIKKSVINHSSLQLKNLMLIHDNLSRRDSPHSFGIAVEKCISARVCPQYY